ncbi:DUF19 domain-containing protein [Caenorhabditis elegans]|uniref:DUF19 domain-containing protein n=1 Tax=Caenorhabditis elegans TaxID=6239 RepID=Q20790_CAEEL|nr:DUF19 domain-containing protein [Caenorhabditis elegans]CAA91756.1 DUF19 domain-containing protein [Caenorhabditis elegans]|eukprot:NP_509978.1 Uncharacterized protein CELE_F54F7.3 [Caenorhabditis elegans]
MNTRIVLFCLTVFFIRNSLSAESSSEKKIPPANSVDSNKSLCITHLKIFETCIDGLHNAYKKINEEDLISGNINKTITLKLELYHSSCFKYALCLNSAVNQTIQNFVTVMDDNIDQISDDCIHPKNNAIENCSTEDQLFKEFAAKAGYRAISVLNDYVKEVQQKTKGASRFSLFLSICVTMITLKFYLL